MKKYIVRYSYNHGLIESTMIIYAKDPEEAAETAREYTITRVISVKEA